MRIIGNDPNVPRQTQEVASGTLPNGKPVVVNADGTVSVVSGVSESLGDQVVVASHQSTGNVSVYDTGQDKVLFIYKNASDYGTAVVGTVSGSSISFGTPVVFQSASTQYLAATYDSNVGKTGIFFADYGQSEYGKAIVATISGTSVSFGSVATFSSTTTSGAKDSTFDSSQNKIILAYQESSSAMCIKAATISGTSISFGSKTTFVSGDSSGHFEIAYNANDQKSLLVYTNPSTNQPNAVVVTASGSTITIGSAATVASETSDFTFAVYDATSQKIVVAYRATNTVKFGVATISGTSVSFGTFVNSGINFGQNPATSVFHHNVAAGKVVLASRNDANSYYQTYITGTVSGTDITLDTAVVYYAGTSYGASSVYDPDQQKSVLFYTNSGWNNPSAKILTVGSTTLTSENYIGMSGGAVIFNSATEAIGSEAVFESATTSIVCAAYDSNENKTVIVYKDNGNSNYGTAVVATVSGNSVSYGTPVVFEAATTGHTSVAFDSNSNKIVIAYADSGNSNHGTAIVGTVSGTSISFGTPVIYNAANTAYNSVVFDSSNNKIVIAYTDSGSSSHGTAVVGTVSGTSISFGSEVVFESASTAYVSAAFDSNSNKVVIGYQDTGNSGHGTSIVGTVSGTSISFGSATVFESAYVSYVQVGFDSTNNKIVIAYQDEGNSYYGTSIVGTVSGTSISFGTAAVFQSSQANVYSVVHDSNAQKTVIFFRDQTSSQKGTVINGTVSGTSISFNTKFVVAAGVTEGHTQNAVFDSTANKIVIAFRDDSNSSYGTAVVYQTAFDNTNRGQVADGGHALIDTQGAISDNQTGLTAGQSYFVQTDGTLGTTAGDPSVVAGTAVLATKLIVKG